MQKLLDPRPVAFTQEEMLDGELADRQARLQAVLVGGAEMDAAVKTAERGLGCRGGKAVEASAHSRQKVRARGEGYVVGAVIGGQHCRRRAAERGVTRDVVGEGRGDDEGTPV